MSHSLTPVINPMLPKAFKPESPLRFQTYLRQTLDPKSDIFVSDHSVYIKKCSNALFHVRIIRILSLYSEVDIARGDPYMHMMGVR